MIKITLGRTITCLADSHPGLILAPMQLFLIALSTISAAVPPQPAAAGTLSECGWRGTTDLRCYEETNGRFGYQPDQERYWEGGVNQGRSWCEQNGGLWLQAANDLSQRCSLPFR